MSLAPEVQALVDQVAAIKAAADAAVAKFGELGSQVSALQTQISAIVPSAPIDAEDLAAIKDATASLGSALSEITEVLTAPAAPAADIPADPAALH